MNRLSSSKESGDRFYEFGFEESYGCLVGTHARIRMLPSAVMSLCEVAAYEYSKGKNSCRQNP